MRFVAGLVTVVLGWAGQAAGFQGATQAAAPPTSTKVVCNADPTLPTPADRALLARKYPEAEQMYQATLAADPKSSAAKAGLVRTTLAEGKLADALAMAIKFDAAQPDDPLLLDALGAVRFRRGEVNEAAITLNKSANLNPCIGLTHLEMARFFNLNGMYQSAQRQLELAHTVSPADPEITRRWRISHTPPPTDDQRLAMLKSRLENPSLTDEQKEGINAAIKGIETHERGDCTLVSPVQPVKVPILPISRGGVMTPDNMYAAGLEVSFNGKKRRMEIDTGASGILLSRSVAKAAGLVPELETKIGGIGDNGPAGTYVTHVDDIKIGSMEFKNCVVRVLEQNSQLEVDGLIGPDVFRDYLVTLDIPGREVRLGPLPARPDEKPARVTSLAASDDETAEGDKPLSPADRARDRYVAPEMADWSRVFRYGHFLIFPTQIGNAPLKLFMMDTGASRGMITPAAAREVTHVSSDSDQHIVGLNGEVKKVMAADNVTITFAGVRQNIQGLSSYDSTLMSRGAGVEVSGLIGFPTLRELVIMIDYRDNLVKIIYDPKKGFHAR